MLLWWRRFTFRKKSAPASRILVRGGRGFFANLDLYICCAAAYAGFLKISISAYDFGGVVCVIFLNPIFRIRSAQKRMRYFRESHFLHMHCQKTYAFFSRISFSTYALPKNICVIFINLIFRIRSAQKHMRFFREFHFLHMPIV